MSKPTYTAADFDLPKVKGLAVHNAKLATNKAQEEYNDTKSATSSYWIVPEELQSYCLFIVHPDCSVMAVAGAATSGDFAKFVGVSNLSALASKYKCIGFVAHRDSMNRKKAEVVTMAVPLRRRTK